MEVISFEDPAEFRSVADSLLLANEAENCLMLGVTGTLIDSPHIYDTFYLWVVRDGDSPVAAAAMTPPHNVLIAKTDSQQAVRELAEHIHRAGIDLPGAQGNVPAIDDFCRSWRALRSVDSSLEFKLGLHALEKVSPVAKVRGRSRLASDDDYGLLLEWFTSFIEEADPESDRSNMERAVESRLQTDPALGGTWLWEVDGQPVALSGYGGRTPRGIRIGPVYTPPSARRQGYATALVAEQTEWLLAGGRDFCFLFTDMSSPTPNSIYRRIGYRKIADALRYGFSPT